MGIMVFAVWQIKTMMLINVCLCPALYNNTGTVSTCEKSELHFEKDMPCLNASIVGEMKRSAKSVDVSVAINNTLGKAKLSGTIL
jgi:hypothetical protein